LKIYEPTEISVLRLLLNSGDLVVDGGANLGIYSKRISKIVGKKGKVFAFEPISFLIDFMKLHHKYSNIDFISLALSDVEASRKIIIPLIGKDLIEPSLATLNHKTVDGLVQNIQSVRLDNFIKPEMKVKFIKLDLEGHEISALLGSKRILLESRPIVQFEENNMNQNVNYYTQFLKEVNYKIYKINLIFYKESTNYYLFPDEKIQELLRLFNKSYILKEIK
jgi:FkbM family methyltransferase